MEQEIQSTVSSPVAPSGRGQEPGWFRLGREEDITTTRGFGKSDPGFRGLCVKALLAQGP